MDVIVLIEKSLAGEFGVAKMSHARLELHSSTKVNKPPTPSV
jgi:hypothetical protein